VRLPPRHANDVWLEAMTPELLTLDLRQAVPSVRVPVFFFLGRYDHRIGSAIAARYFESLEAPYKRLIWFEHSAYNVPFEEPARFDDTVTRELGDIGIEACRLRARKRVLPGSADDSHRPAVSTAAEEPITAVRLQPRYAHARGHPQRLQNLACSGVDSPQLALVAFPGPVPERAVDPGNAGDKAAGFERAENFPGLGVDLMDLAVAILSHPERAFRPREPRISAVAGRRYGGEDLAGFGVDLLDAILDDLKQVPAVEGRSCMRGDIDRAPYFPARGIDGIQPVSGSEPDIFPVIGHPVHIVGTWKGTVLTDNFSGRSSHRDTLLSG